MTETLLPPLAPSLGQGGPCRNCLPVDSDLVAAFGHDPIGHRLVSSLLRAGISTRSQLATRTDLQLLVLRHIGTCGLARIRAHIPAPAAAPAPATLQAATPATAQNAPPPVPVLPVRPVRAAGAERMQTALLLRLPAEVEFTERMLADSATAAALWALTAISRTDPRLWRHIHPPRIGFYGLIREDWSPVERTLLRIAYTLAGWRRKQLRFDLHQLAAELDQDQWHALTTALRVGHAALRGEGHATRQPETYPETTDV